MPSSKRLVLLVIALVAVIIVSLFVVQYISKPSLSHISSPTPTPSLSPTESAPTPSSTATATSRPTTPPPSASPSPTPTPHLYPGEVTEYQNQSLTPISNFIVDFLGTSIEGAQEINQTTYRLTITGLVNQTLEYSYSDVVNNFQAQRQVIPIICVVGWGANVLWEGVYVNDLLQQTGISPQANTLIFYASDGYSTALPLSEVQGENMILAYKMNNVTLSSQTGWPFILVAQNQYGYKWIKWLTEIEVSSNSGYLGYWESRGYPNDATIGSFNPIPLPNTMSPATFMGSYLGGTMMFVTTYIALVREDTKRPRSTKAT